MSNRFSLLCLSVSFSLALYSLPQQGNVATGTAEIVQNNDFMQITASDRAILNWDSFSIDKIETLQFVQPTDKSAVLNRVIGLTESRLDGKLFANGHVYLINPNGLIIGKDAVIDTAKFVGSTLQISNEDFSNNTDLLFQGDSTASIVNLGTIQSSQGPVTLIAHKIDNQGKIASPEEVSLIAGHEILLSSSGNLLRVRPDIKSEGIESSGVIQSLQTTIERDGLHSLAIQTMDEHDASEIVAVGGKILLRAEGGAVVVSGELTATGNAGGSVHILGETVRIKDGTVIDASGVYGGGEILIGGDYQGSNPDIPNALLTFIEPNIRLKADAVENGNGGKVIVWSDKSTYYYGESSVRGGAKGGDGGLTEVSGEFLVFQGSADSSAVLGRIGTLLLDPTNITINTTDAVTYTFASITPALPCTAALENEINYTGSPASTTIKNTTLVAQLGNNCVLLNTSAPGSGAGLGSITVSDPVSWSATTTLTLIADEFITVSAGAPISNTSSTTGFTAISLQNNATAPATYVGITLDAQLNSVGGDISITGKGVGNSGVLISGTSVTSTGGGNITVNGTAGMSTLAAVSGISLTGASIISTIGSGAIMLTGNGGVGGTLFSSDGVSFAGTAMVTSVNGALTIMGTGGSGVNSNVGISSTGVTTISSTSGLITLQGTGGGASTGGIGVNATGAGTNIFKVSTTASPGGVDITGMGSVSGATGVFLENTQISTMGGGPITITGKAAAAGTATPGINFGMTTASSITTDTGTIMLIGTAQGTASAANGITINTGSSIKTTVGGSITLTGFGSGNTGIGCSFTGTTMVEGTNADIMITGTGGNGTGANEGLSFAGTSTVSTTSNGTITLMGAGGTGTTLAVDGILFAGTSMVTSAQGNISIVGTGGTGTTGSNLGISSTGATTISSTSGTITMMGTGGVATGASAGISATGTTTNILKLSTTAAPGNINITGIGNGTGTGTTLENTQISTTGGGNVSVKGMGGTNPVGVAGINLGTGTASSITSSGTITLMGIASGTTGSGNGIVVNTGCSITTNALPGAIKITGMGFNSGTGFSFTGSTVQATGGDDISITGTSGDGIGTIEGVIFNGISTVSTSATGAGTISITGTGGSGATGIIYGIDSAGTTTISSGSGAITLTGSGGTMTTGSAHGIFTTGVTMITSATGTIKLTGTGGALSGSGLGVFINGSANLCTITTASPGSITLKGTAQNDGMGVDIDTAHIATTGGGAITITGIGGSGTGTGNNGINVGTSMPLVPSIASDTGTITLTGTGNGTGAGKGIGININGNVLIETTATGGQINMVGIGAGAGSSGGNGISFTGLLSSVGGTNMMKGMTSAGSSAGIGLIANFSLSLTSGATMTMTGIGNQSFGAILGPGNPANVTLTGGAQWIFDSCLGGQGNSINAVAWDGKVSTGLNLVESSSGPLNSVIYKNCTAGTSPGGQGDQGILFYGGSQLECTYTNIVFENITGGGDGGFGNYGVWNEGTIFAPSITATNCVSGTNSSAAVLGFYTSNILGDSTYTKNISISASGTSLPLGLGELIGIEIRGTLEVAPTGTIMLNGTGGMTPGNTVGGHTGVLITGTVTLGDFATLTIAGTGGFGTGAAAASTGVIIGASTVFNLGQGTSVIFQDCTGGTNTTGGNIGVLWEPTAAPNVNTGCSFIFGTSSGPIIGGTSGGGGGSNYGVEIGTALELPFTSTSIIFNNVKGGDSGNGTSSNHGVLVTADIAAETITGTNIKSGAGKNNNIGFYLTNGAVMGSGLTQSIAVTATSLGSGSGEVGVQVDQVSEISVSGTATISLTGSSNFYGISITDATTEIISANGNITFASPGSSMFFGNGITIQSVGSGSILALADVNIVESGGASITTMGGPIILVVDNAFPTPPGVGPGVFNIPDLVLTTNGGSLQLYGGLLNTGIFPATLNGSSYVAGLYQQNGIYYPTGAYTAGAPYFIYYKTLPANIISPAISNFTIAIAEAFQSWANNWYQDYLDQDRYPPAYTPKGMNIIIPSLVELKPTRQQNFVLQEQKEKSLPLKKK